MGKRAPMDLLEKGYYRFVAIFTWPAGEDQTARDRLRYYFDNLDKLSHETGIVPEFAEAYSLTGARTTIVIGYTNSAQGLYKYCESVIFNSPVEAEVYHAVEPFEQYGDPK
jgi:hypothetical protein